MRPPSCFALTRFAGFASTPSLDRPQRRERNTSERRCKAARQRRAPILPSGSRWTMPVWPMCPQCERNHMDTPRSQRQDAPEPRKRPADRGGRLRLAILLVALALGGCATAPPPPTTYVAGTLAPACDSSTNGSTSTTSNTSGCVRKSATAPPEKPRCTGFLDLRVLYGTCTE